MIDLIEAAKAVIDYWHRSWPMGDKLIQLRAAVERAEKPPVGFEEWADNNNLSAYGRACSQKAWQDATKAERERIRVIIKAVGAQGNHSEWFDCVDTILERIDVAL